MHLAINVYLDGGKPGTSAGFDIKERSRSACGGDFWLSPTAGEGGGVDIEFFLTRDAMLEWKLRKTWLPLKMHKQGRGVIGKDGSHSSTKDLWVSY